jgi:RimJ/RimL family protein N-acetyltransferase
VSPVRERLETERLVGERVREGHLDRLVELHSEPRVAEWLGGVPREWSWLQTKLEHWEEHGYGDWIFSEREGGLVVGRCGLRWVVIDDADEVEVGYMVDPDRWGLGYATEMTRAVVEAGFALGLEDIVAFTLPDNVRSRRVMEKSGLAYERPIEWAGLPHVLYRIRRGSSSEG